MGLRGRERGREIRVMSGFNEAVMHSLDGSYDQSLDGSYGQAKPFRDGGELEAANTKL